MSLLPGAGGQLGTVIAAGCHQLPHQWGLGSSGKVANLVWAALLAGGLTTCRR